MEVLGPRGEVRGDCHLDNVDEGRVETEVTDSTTCFEQDGVRRSECGYESTSVRILFNGLSETVTSLGCRSPSSLSLESIERLRRREEGDILETGMIRLHSRDRDDDLADRLVPRSGVGGMVSYLGRHFPNERIDSESGFPRFNLFDDASESPIAPPLSQVLACKLSHFERRYLLSGLRIDRVLANAAFDALQPDKLLEACDGV